MAGGTAWERIAKLVDLSDKGVRAGRGDKTQFRAMLLSLRKDEKVVPPRALSLPLPLPVLTGCRPLVRADTDGKAHSE